jgi:hypothetical protein
MISFQLAFGTFFLTILGLRRTAQQRGRSATVRSITTPLSSRTRHTFVGGGMSAGRVTAA